MNRRRGLPWLLALAAGGGPLVSRPAGAVEPGPLPCRPGVIRPKPVATPARGPSPEVVEREADLAALRQAVARYRERVDDAVQTAYRQEREALRRKFVAKSTPLEVAERARRAEAIAAFRGFLERHAGDAAEADVAFRLAELLFEDASDRYLVARRTWEAEAGKRRDAPSTPPPRPDYAEAVAAYRRVVSRFPSFPRRDSAQYMIAWCLGEQGDSKGSRDAFEALARLPQTSHRAEAWLRVGEYHFDRAEHDAAIDAYRRSAGEGAGPFRDKALYKLAWSHYRRGAGHARPESWAESAAAFAELVENEPESPLRSEALQYLAIIYADHGGLPAVKAAVAGKPWGAEVIEALAYVWFEQANWEDAEQTYELALAARPDHDEAPLWLNRRATALDRLGRDAEAAAARETLHARYGAGSVWQTQKAASPAVVAAADAVAEPALLGAAVFRHQRAQWTRAESDYEHAARLYGEYLQRYPGRPAAYDLAFYRAECLYFASRLEEAAEAYGTVLEFTTEGPWHAEAAFSRFKAREVLAGGAPAVEEPPAGAADRPIPGPMLALAKAAEDFTCVAPTDWRVPEALFRGAQVYYAHGRLAAARERAEAVIAAAPKEDFAAYSAALAVDAWRLERRWDRVQEVAESLSGASLGRTPALVKSVRESLARVAVEAGFQVAKALDERGLHEAAAEKLLSIAQRAPGVGLPGLVPKAIFGAADSLEKAGRSARAAQLFGEVATRHPADPLSEAAAFRRAQNLARILEVETAARAYASFVAAHPFSADTPAAAWNAVLLWEAAGRPAETAAAYERFANEGTRQVADRAAAWIAAAEAWVAAGKPAAAKRDLERVSRSGDTPDALRVQALAALAGLLPRKDAERELVEAVDLQTDLVRNGTGTPESARAAAVVALGAAEARYHAFESAPLPSSGDAAKLEAAIRAKNDELLRAREAYLTVAGLGDPDATTRALHRIGEGYASLALAIRNLPPESVDHDLVARPLEDAAIAALARNVELADGAALATEWTAKSRRMLARLSPSLYATPREDAVAMPEDDVWALPPMIEPDTLLASAGGASPSPLARTLAEVVPRFLAARRDGDLAALRRVESEIAGAVTGLPPGATARDTAVAWHDLGVAREALGDLRGAALAFRTALDADATVLPAAAGLTATLARAGDAHEAASFARDWLKRHPGDAGVRVNLSGALRLRKDTPAALAMAVEALSADARDARARRAAVAAAVAAKRRALALFAARQGTALTPEDPETALTLGMLLRRTARGRIDLDAGRGVLLEAAGRHPDHARLAHAAGVALLQDGDAAKARPLLERAAARSFDPDAWTALSAARRRTADTAGATEAAGHALALAPGHAGALRTLGLARLDAGDLAGAEDAFQRYVAETAKTRGPADPVPGWLTEVRERIRAAASSPPTGGRP